MYVHIPYMDPMGYFLGSNVALRGFWLISYNIINPKQGCRIEHIEPTYLLRSSDLVQITRVVVSTIVYVHPDPWGK